MILNFGQRKEKQHKQKLLTLVSLFNRRIRANECLLCGFNEPLEEGPITKDEELTAMATVMTLIEDGIITAEQILKETS